MREYSIVVVGSAGVGKSAFIRKFVEANESEVVPYDGTGPADAADAATHTSIMRRPTRLRWMVDGEQCVLSIRDALVWRKGDDEYRPYAESLIQGSEGFLCLYSVTSRDESYDTVEELHELILRLKQADAVPMVIVGNKCDVEKGRMITTDEGAFLANIYRCPFLEASAVTGAGVEEAFDQLVREIKSDVRRKREEVEVVAEIGEKEGDGCVVA
eukprot:TRINITY_DN13444_c0_g1_i1.p1 TRINITY_DN13444_c0_g1~~TRINITY_DN13444_c0_g1_i1.p1  ORF type:complete len:214 (+),score=42.07 TRINITY_DN13444_c0_g1_i1:302-943(+)